MKRIACLVAAIGIALGTWFLVIHIYFKEAGTVEVYRNNSTVLSEALLITDKEIDSVYLYLVFPAGEALNTLDVGLAHYVEHLAWLSAFGSADEDRHSNAWTNHFSTGYWQKRTVDDLHEGLQTLISVTAPLSVDIDFALQERDIILREYDLRVSEWPLTTVLRDMNKSLFGNGALARSVIGEPSVISQYSVDVARDLHLKSHILSRATLLIYGNVSKTQFQDLLTSLPTGIQGNPVMASHSMILADDTSMVNDASFSLPDIAEDTFLYRKLSSLPDCGLPEYCEMIALIAENTLDSALPGGLAGPLKFDQFVARSFSLDITLIPNQYAELNFTAHPDNGISLQELRQLFENELKRRFEDGIPRETFNRIVKRLKDDLDGVLTRNRPGYNRDLVLGQLMSGKPLFFLSEQRKALDSIHLDDVNSFLKALLAKGRKVTRLVTSKRD